MNHEQISVAAREFCKRLNEDQSTPVDTLLNDMVYGATIILASVCRGRGFQQTFEHVFANLINNDDFLDPTDSGAALDALLLFRQLMELRRGTQKGGAHAN